MSVFSEEEKMFLAQIRQRHITKDPPVTLDEMKKSILMLRQRRLSALSVKSEEKKAAPRAKPTAVQIASALDEFDNF